MSKMELMTIREQQLVELEIMKEIHRVCEENSINYWLMYGSLIGAVRHEGFIPWDDDIDVAMMRDEYNRFIEVCANGALSEHFIIQNYHTDSDFEFIISRIGMEGTYSDTASRRKMNSMSYCYVDVFPFDIVPDDESKRNKHMQQISKLKKDIRYRRNYSYDCNSLVKKFCKRIVEKIYSIHSIAWYARKLEKTATQYSESKSSLCAGLGGGYKYQKEIQFLEDFKQLELRPFEDTQFYIPHNYDRILKNLYGDYMTLPPESQRVSKHKAYRIIE